jgi:hypothetical protein
LKARQESSGAFSGAVQVELRDTAESVRALLSFDPNDPRVAAGFAFLNAARSPTLDLEARRLVSLREALPDFLLDDQMLALLASRAPDGGWGFDGQFVQSTALETALVLRALASSERLDATVLFAGLGRLSDLQRPDGGFASSVGGVSEVPTSAEVLLSLADLAVRTNVDRLRDSTAGFVLSRMNADGGFSSVAGATSDLTTTALSVQALVAGGAPARFLLPSLVYLVAGQLPDGSWLGDVYTTALALQVAGSERPDLAVDSWLVSPVSVEQGAPAAGNVLVTNAGLAPSPMTTIGLYTADPNAGGVALSQVSVPPLAPGASFSHTFAVDTAGFVGSLALYAVVDPAKQVSEIVETNNRKSALLLVRAPGSPPPPDGNLPPVITSLPPLTAVMGQSFTYQMVAFDPEGGPVEYGINSDGRKPPGMTINQAGLVTWTPDRTGWRSPNVFARDAQGATTIQNIALEVIAADAKRPPVFESFALSAARPGQLYAYTAQVRDPDGGTVSVALTQGPPGMIFDPGTLRLTWTPTLADLGEHRVVLSAVDDDVQTTEQSWLLVVRKATDDAVDLVMLSVNGQGAFSSAQNRTAGGTIRVRIANQGAANATNVQVAAAEDRNQDGVFSSEADGVLGSVVVASLAAGETAEVEIAVAGALIFRDNRIFGVADPSDAITETREDNNDLASGEEERLFATQGAFEPELKLHWQGTDPTAFEDPTWLITTPMVAQINDDNGDGRVDSGDETDIVFIAYPTLTATGTALRAISGKTGDLILDYRPAGEAIVTPAVADADSDGVPEIYFGTTDSLYAINPDGSERWAKMLSSYDDEIAIADLDKDGMGEIIYASRIYRHDGSEYCILPGGLGAPVVADLDLDGSLEIILSYMVLRADCSMYWVAGPAFSYLQWSVGQLDDDPYPELFAKGTNRYHIFEHDGTLVRSVVVPDGWLGTSPAIGDVDGDPQSEIVVVSEPGAVRVLEADGEVKWSASALDATSVSNTATVADLDGDGRGEVIYQDGGSFRILNGIDGAVLFQAMAASGTGDEYVVPADVDGDGRFDLVTVGNGNMTGNGPIDLFGIKVFGDARWAAARPLWNQHSYHVSNIRCDQKLPVTEPHIWQVTRDSFRAGGEVPRSIRQQLGCAVGPGDLTASYIRVERSSCGVSVDYIVRVGNGGNNTIGSGAPVRFSHSVGTGPIEILGTVNTSIALPPGAFEDVRFTLNGPPPGPVSVMVDVDPDATIEDPRRHNNVHSLTVPLCESANRDPAFSSDPLLVAVVGQPYLYTALASDPDGDPLAYSLTSGPSGMSLTGDGTLQWTPASQQMGPNLVAIRVDDGRGGVDVQEFIVTVSMPEVGLPPPLPLIGDATLSIASDAATYGVGAVAVFTATLTNERTSGRAGTIRIELFDETGNAFVTLLPEQTVLFTGAGQQEITATFDVGLTLPWTYTAVATYLEETSDGVRWQLTTETNFDVIGSGVLDLAVATDRVVYQPGQRAALTRRLYNDGTIERVDVTTTLDVLGPDQTVVFTESYGPYDLAAGELSQRLTFFDIGARPDGTYTARLTARQGATTLGVQQRTFRVASTARLTGDLSVAPDPVARGAQVVLTGTFANSGNAGIAGQALFRIVNPDTLETIVETSLSLTLAPAETRTLSASFGTFNLTPRVYLAQVLVYPPAGPPVFELSNAFRVVEPGALSVAIEVDACSGTPSVTPIVTIVGGGILLEERLLDGAPWDGSPITAEGAHTLFVRVSNATGSQAQDTAAFIIDRTPPAIDVGGIVAGDFYSAAVAPTFAVTDANLVTFGGHLNGIPFSSGNSVGFEGGYTLMVTGEDCAGNAADELVGFTLDFTDPIVTVDVPACGGGAVSPVVSVTEAHVASDVRRLNGSTWDGAPITAEGTHELEVTITDRAGNTGSASATFVIDRTAPAIVITGVADGGIYTTPVTPIALVTDTNPTTTQATLNDVPYTSGTIIAVNGTYTLQVLALDCAGNSANRSVAFMIGQSSIAGALEHATLSDARVLLATECGNCPPLAGTVIAQTLDSQGIGFETAVGRTAWQQKLRTGRFNLYIIYKPGSSESGSAFRELNESVWMGDSLILVKDHPDAMPFLRESLGVDFHGKIKNVQGVTLYAPVQPSSVAASGDAVEVAPLVPTATIFGRSSAPKVKPIAALNAVGLGRAITLAWNAETSNSTVLYGSVLDAAEPAIGTPLLPRGPARVRVTVTNLSSSSAATFDVSHTFDPALTASDPLTRSLAVVPQANSSFGLTFGLPEQTGSFAINGTLRVAGQLVDTDAFTFNVPRAFTQIGSDVIGALHGLALTGGEANARNQAVDHVQQASTASAESAIDRMLQAIDRVRQITSADVTAIRIDMARLLRAYQLRWQP